MANKIKITKKKLPFLKGDLDLDPTVVNRINTVQRNFQIQFNDRITEAKNMAVREYNLKIETLKAAKSDALATYNSEIRKYEKFIKNVEDVKLEEDPKDTGKDKASSTVQKAAGKRIAKKAPARTATRKTTARKTSVKKTPNKK